jgi:hypothetical protein
VKPLHIRKVGWSTAPFGCYHWRKNAPSLQHKAFPAIPEMLTGKLDHWLRAKKKKLITTQLKKKHLA